MRCMLPEWLNSIALKGRLTMVLENKKILVTGAGGFIGSHLVEALVAGGANVRAMIKYNSRSDIGMLADTPESIQDNVEVIFGDIRDSFFVQKAVHGCDYVFHLAALIGIPYSYVAPNDYVSVNIQGIINVLEACRSEQVDRLIHTSTSEVYGTAQYVPIDEDHVLQGQSPYSASKIAADQMVQAYYRSYDLPVVTVRPFNTFGPRQSARAFIPTVIVQALTGDQLVLGSLDPVRDMTYVSDTAAGFIQVGLCDRAIGQVINLGVGRGESVGTIVRMILRRLKRDNMEIIQSSERIRPSKSEVMRLISDNALAREMCSWAPQYSLEDGLDATIKWIEKNLDRYQPTAYTV